MSSSVDNQLVWSYKSSEVDKPGIEWRFPEVFTTSRADQLSPKANKEVDSRTLNESYKLTDTSFIGSEKDMKSSTNQTSKDKKDYKSEYYVRPIPTYDEIRGQREQQQKSSSTRNSGQQTDTNQKPKLTKTQTSTPVKDTGFDPLPDWDPSPINPQNFHKQSKTQTSTPVKNTGFDPLPDWDPSPINPQNFGKQSKTQTSTPVKNTGFDPLPDWDPSPINPQNFDKQNKNQDLDDDRESDFNDKIKEWNSDEDDDFGEEEGEDNDSGQQTDSNKQPKLTKTQTSTPVRNSGFDPIPDWDPSPINPQNFDKQNKNQDLDDGRESDEEDDFGEEEEEGEDNDSQSSQHMNNKSTKILGTDSVIDVAPLDSSTPVQYLLYDISGYGFVGDVPIGVISGPIVGLANYKNIGHSLNTSNTPYALRAVLYNHLSPKMKNHLQYLLTAKNLLKIRCISNARIHIYGESGDGIVIDQNAEYIKLVGEPYIRIDGQFEVIDPQFIYEWFHHLRDSEKNSHFIYSNHRIICFMP